MPLAAGADARPFGWVLVVLRDGRLDSFQLHRSLAGVREATERADALAVDVPLGHDDAEGGERACDRALRSWLGPRGGSVEPAPPPDVWSMASLPDAIEACRERGWPEPSERAWSLRERVREGLRLWGEGAQALHEAHPEASFQMLHRVHRKEPHVPHPRAGRQGFVHRLQLLHDAGLRPARSMGGSGRASPRDVLEATALAWTADRIARGEAEVLPAGGRVEDPVVGRRVEVRC